MRTNGGRDKRAKPTAAISAPREFLRRIPNLAWLSEVWGRGEGLRFVVWGVLGWLFETEEERVECLLSLEKTESCWDEKEYAAKLESQKVKHGIRRVGILLLLCLLFVKA